MLVGPESGPEVQKNGWVFVRRIGEAQHRPGVGLGAVLMGEVADNYRNSLRQGERRPPQVAGPGSPEIGRGAGAPLPQGAGAGGPARPRGARPEGGGWPGPRPGRGRAASSEGTSEAASRAGRGLPAEGAGQRARR